MKIVIGTIGAWLSSSYAKEDPTAFENLSFTPCDMSEHGWVKVGEASVEVSLFSNKEIVNGQLSMLNEAKRRVQAEAEKKLNEIEGQIQSLLCIEYQP